MSAGNSSTLTTSHTFRVTVFDESCLGSAVLSHLLAVSNSCLIQKHSTEDMEDIFIEYFIT